MIKKEKLPDGGFSFFYVLWIKNDDMKHLICILFFITIASGVYGQRSDLNKEFHELRLGMGFLSIPTVFEFWKSIDYDSPSDDEQTIYEGPKTYLPSFHLGYSYRLKKWLSLGLEFTYTCSYQNTYDLYTDKKTERNYKYYVGITPVLRFHWVRTRYVQLYSSVGIGIGYYGDTEKKEDSKTRSIELAPSIHFNQIGITVGRKLFGFTELAVSSESILRLGIGYRFND